jgi:hypothetical protein
MFGGLVPDHWNAKIAIHFAHRTGALVVTAAVIMLFVFVRGRHRDRSELTRPVMLFAALVAVQITLGALTVLSLRDPWINSAHVVCGALVLTTSLVIALRTWRGVIADVALREPQGAPSLPIGGMRNAPFDLGSGRPEPRRGTDSISDFGVRIADPAPFYRPISNSESSIDNPVRSPQSAIGNPIRNPQSAIRNTPGRA